MNSLRTTDSQIKLQCEALGEMIAQMNLASVNHVGCLFVLVKIIPLTFQHETDIVIRKTLKFMVPQSTRSPAM